MELQKLLEHNKRYLVRQEVVEMPPAEPEKKRMKRIGGGFTVKPPPESKQQKQR